MARFEENYVEVINVKPSISSFRANPNGNIPSHYPRLARLEAEETDRRLKVHSALQIDPSSRVMFVTNHF